ncbi:MAG TPA: radical SAM/SPASM domain-containing protein [Thermoanaerobaculia bacterium]
MSTDTLPVLASRGTSAPARGLAGWRLNPFLHLGPERIYDPLTDRMLASGEAGFAALARLVAGGGEIEELPAGERELLAAGGWLLPAAEDPSRRFLLKYVSLEAHTVCNQTCYFCPVSIAPREDYFMPTELYERIVGELAAFRETIDGVFMINYNEPTLDKRFVEQVRTIKDAGLPPAVLTNATGLTPRRVDAIVAMGGLRYLSVNLSTVDRDRYRDDRGGDHLKLVLANLEYMKDRPVAERMDMVVLGTADANHRRDFEEIRERFAGSRFEVKSYEVMDRAGYMQIGARPARDGRRLCGCDNIGSRPLQHLHITPRGQCVLCCEDYDERYVVGDLTETSVAEVLRGPEMARLRRWVYGLEEAPEDFICRGCTFALTRPA